MSQSDTTMCPECETQQPDTAPFCQNCGYRMRSPKTIRETAVPVSSDDNGSDDQTSAAPSSSEAPQSGGRPSRRMVTGDDNTEKAASPSPPDRSGATEQSPVDTSSDTIVEGMRAVSDDDTSGTSRTDSDADPTPDEQSSGPDSEAHPARQSGAETSPIEAQRTRIRWIVGGTVAACIAVVTGLTFLHLDRGEAAETTEREAVEPEIIEIEEGRFRRGLAEDAEAFILEFCYRYHDDPERDCARERLLEGEYPQETVQMPAYRIDSIPVRNVDYRECVDDDGCEPIAYDDCDVWTPRGLQMGVRVPDVLRRDNRPVVCVDYERAADYCRYRGGHLPTHNQWEKAARGDASPLFPWGNRWEPERANWGEMDVMQTSIAGEVDGYAWTSPPGAFPDNKSPHGLYDMAGNVNEWIHAEDGALTSHVRGGSWISNPFELRTTAREEFELETTRTDVGFRCAYPAD